MNQQLSKLIDEAHAISAEVQTVFGNLKEEQLNWKPSPDEWSVAQCFDHLIVTNTGYLPLIKKIAGGQHKPSLKERLPLLPRAFGSIVLNAVQPQAQRKFKAVPKFQPSSSAIQSDILARFTTHQEDVVKHMRMTVPSLDKGSPWKFISSCKSVNELAEVFHLLHRIFQSVDTAAHT